MDAAERSFMGKKEQLRKEFQNKLNNIVSYQTELVQMKKAMQILIARVGSHFLDYFFVVANYQMY